MNDNHKYSFYALNVNGHTSSLFPEREEALDELVMRVNEDDTDTYEIERIDGIWNMLARYSDFEDRYDDEWMEEVLRVTCQMIFDKEDALLEQSKADDPPTKAKEK